MTEPRRWVEDGATPIEKALLDAGRADGPRKGVDVRILAAVQQSAPATFKATALARWGKVLVVAAFAGGAALVAHQSLTHRASPTAVAIPPEAEATAAKAGPSPLVADPISTAEVVQPGPPDEGPAVATRAGSPRRRARTTAVMLDHSLADETKVLDLAREALDTRRPAEALRTLDDFGRRFPKARLRPEAMVLRLAALAQAGRRQAADSLAAELLSDESYRPYAQRIQSLLREMGP